MEVTFITQEKDHVEARVSNQTAAEILRVYLQNQGVQFAAWRKDHPSKPLIFNIQTSGKTVKKAVSDAVAAIKKDCDAMGKALKK